MPRAAKVLLACALPACVVGRRASEGAQANLTVDAPVIPDAMAEAMSAWWKNYDAYVGHKYVLTFSDCWTIYNNLLKIKSVADQKRAATAFAVTGEFFTTLEAAQDVDRAYTAALGAKTDGETAWNCDQYYPDEDQPKMKFTKGSFLPTHTFESANDAKCLNTVRSQMGVIRWSICHVEAQANAWAEEMASKDLKDFFMDTMRGKSCKGEKETCVRPKDKTDCAKECEQSANCTAVGYKDKKRECCFMEGDVQVSAGANTEQCFEKLGPRELFLTLDPKGVSEWMAAKGFDAPAKTAKEYGGFGLSGIVLAFMTEPTLAKWLALESVQEAQALRCRILAELDNEPGRECPLAPKPPTSAEKFRAIVTGNKPIKSKYIDHGLLWPKGAHGKFYSIKWVSDFFRRYAPQANTKKWATMIYDLSATWLNANGFHKIVLKGPEGLMSPFVALKSIATSTGLIKFHEATRFMSCEHVRKQLEPIIEQMRMVPLKQTQVVQQRMRGV